MMNSDKFLKKPVEKIQRQLKKDLLEAGMQKDEKDFAVKGIRHSLVAGICSLVFLLLVFGDILSGIFLATVIFCGVFFFWLSIPRMKKRKKAEMMEKDLPFFLMSLSVQVNVHVPVEKAIENVLRKEKTILAKEFRLALRQVNESGVPIERALLSMSERTDSFMLKRALSQIGAVHKQGGKTNGAPLRSLAKEQLSIQRTQSKEFNGKLVVYSLFFIAISTIIPALFQAMILVGSSFMEMDFSPLQVLLIIAVGFPAIDIITLLFIRSRTPVFLR